MTSSGASPTARRRSRRMSSSAIRLPMRNCVPCVKGQTPWGMTAGFSRRTAPEQSSAGDAPGVMLAVLLLPLALRKALHPLLHGRLDLGNQWNQRPARAGGKTEGRVAEDLRHGDDGSGGVAALGSTRRGQLNGRVHRGGAIDRHLPGEELDDGSLSLWRGRLARVVAERG